MEIMAILKSFIYLTASSLLVPVLVILATLTVWIVIYSGNFAGRSLRRSRLPKSLDIIASLKTQIFTDLPDSVQYFAGELLVMQKNNSEEIAILNLLRESEHQLWKSLDRLKMLIRIGPGLGLIGTLIPMGTGLAALGQGDLSRLSGDLVIAFTTTVVGMALGLVSYFFFTIQRRWVEEDVKNMELVAEILMAEGDQ
jgi:biopolymer transport protein ExbB/TolQ